MIRADAQYDGHPGASRCPRVLVEIGVAVFINSFRIVDANVSGTVFFPCTLSAFGIRSHRSDWLQKIIFNSDSATLNHRDHFSVHRTVFFSLFSYIFRRKASSP